MLDMSRSIISLRRTTQANVALSPIQPSKQCNKKSSGVEFGEGVGQNLKKGSVGTVGGFHKIEGVGSPMVTS